VSIELKTTKEGLSWLVLDEGVKIAAVHKVDDRFILAQNGNVKNLGSASNVRKQLGVKDWQPGDANGKCHDYTDLNGYPADRDVYFEAAIEVKRKLPIYTTVPGSKCFFAAGWYRIRIKGRDRVVFCPKLLVLNRNQYWGPFHTEAEASTLNS
jgi:hypothetical protein